MSRGQTLGDRSGGPSGRSNRRLCSYNCCSTMFEMREGNQAICVGTNSRCNRNRRASYSFCDSYWDERQLDCRDTCFKNSLFGPAFCEADAGSFSFASANAGGPRTLVDFPARARLEILRFLVNKRVSSTRTSKYCNV